MTIAIILVITITINKANFLIIKFYILIINLILKMNVDEETKQIKHSAPLLYSNISSLSEEYINDNILASNNKFNNSNNIIKNKKKWFWDWNKGL